MSHTCPSPACARSVPTHMYACSAHWYALPKPLRDEIWASYREEPLSPRHSAAMRAADEWLRDAA